jgi:undecaprenyl-diphosphatase
MPISDSVLFITTVLASTESFIIVLAVLSLFVMLKRSLREGLFVAGSTVFLLGSVWILKLVFAVSRPTDALVQASGYAFPSGHASGVMFMAIVLEWYFRVVLQIRQLLLMQIALVLFVLAVGYSRLYLQVHTLDQVLAGFLVGGVVGGSFQYYVRRFSSNRE